MRKLLFPLSVAAFIIGMVGYSFAQDANPLSTNLAADTKAASPSHLVTYKDPTYGFALTSPQGWSSITPNKISELTRGAFKPTPDTLIFVVNDADPDQNINIQFAGDARGDAPTNTLARQFLEQMRTQLPIFAKQQMSATFLSSTIVDLAGGVALVMITTSNRGSTVMKQKSITLIVNGKAFTITCTAREATYINADRAGFQPILASLTFK
ncbi:MAG: hypothetical protein WB948_09640 [Desulfobaccales bacterium]